MDRGQQDCSPVTATHIHALPDDCLVAIMRRLDTICDKALPMRNGDGKSVLHPLQCTLVCKRWRALATISIDSLQIVVHSGRDEVAGTYLASRFHHLTALTLSTHWTWLSHKTLVAFAEETPRLKSLDLHAHCDSLPGLADALSRWTNLQRLSLGPQLWFRTSDDVDGMLAVLHLMLSLKYLAFMCKSDLHALFSQVGTIQRLTALELHCPSLPLVSSSGRFPQILQTLLLCGFESSGRLLLAEDEDLGRLSNLRCLRLEDCVGLLELPGSIGCLRKLEVLQLHSCRSLARLPAALGDLSTLTELEINLGSKLVALPESLRRLARLKVCKISRLPCLQMLPEGIGEWRALTRLEISHCDTLRTLPEGLGQLCALQELSIERCSAFASLPQSLGSLSRIRVLQLTWCPKLTTLPSTIEDLPQLQVLEVEHCRELEQLPKGLVMRKGLRVQRLP